MNKTDKVLLDFSGVEMRLLVRILEDRLLDLVLSGRRAKDTGKLLRRIKQQLNGRD